MQNSVNVFKTTIDQTSRVRYHASWAMELTIAYIMK